jgi:CBS domain-containing protein
MFISILKAFFSQMWQIGIEADRRIEELKTGIPIGETVVIKDPQQAWQKVVEMLDNAKEDVILITSSQSLISLLEKDPFEKHHKPGVKFRLMAPIDFDNLEAATKLSSAYEIKHVPINYMTMMLVDDRNLFMFKSAPIDDVSDESFFYLNDTFFTNDKRSSERVREMLNDTWKRGMEISEISAQAAGMKLPKMTVSIMSPVSKIVDTMLKSNINAVIVTQKGEQVGILSDRDILKEVVKSRKDPENALIKDLDYTPLITLTQEQTMTDALRILNKKGTKRMAVAKEGQLIGLLTQDMTKRLKVATTAAS